MPEILLADSELSQREKYFANRRLPSKLQTAIPDNANFTSLQTSIPSQESSVTKSPYLVRQTSSLSNCSVAHQPYRVSLNQNPQIILNSYLDAIDIVQRPFTNKTESQGIDPPSCDIWSSRQVERAANLLLRRSRHYRSRQCDRCVKYSNSMRPRCDTGMSLLYSPYLFNPEDIYDVENNEPLMINTAESFKANKSKTGKVASHVRPLSVGRLKTWSPALSHVADDQGCLNVEQCAFTEKLLNADTKLTAKKSPRNRSSGSLEQNVKTAQSLRSEVPDPILSHVNGKPEVNVSPQITTRKPANIAEETQNKIPELRKTKYLRRSNTEFSEKLCRKPVLPGITRLADIVGDFSGEGQSGNCEVIDTRQYDSYRRVSQ